MENLVLIESRKITLGMPVEARASIMEQENQIHLPRGKFLTTEFLDNVQAKKYLVPSYATKGNEFIVATELDSLAVYAVMLLEDKDVELLKTKFGIHYTNLPNPEYMSGLLIDYFPNSSITIKYNMIRQNEKKDFSELRKLVLTTKRSSLCTAKQTSKSDSADAKLGLYFKACLDLLKLKIKYCKAVEALKNGWPVGGIYLKETRSVLMLK